MVGEKKGMGWGSEEFEEANRKRATLCSRLRAQTQIQLVESYLRLQLFVPALFLHIAPSRTGNGLAFKVNPGIPWHYSS